MKKKGKPGVSGLDGKNWITKKCYCKLVEKADSSAAI
jgi:hypothetical protein